MKEYVQEALKQGYIVPSTFPVLVGFFFCCFVKKILGGLQPCFDYYGLDDIMMKYLYPLPLETTELFS